MQLEKLDLLEKRLGLFVARFAGLKGENDALRKSLDEREARLRELEAEVGLFRSERERIRDSLDRIIEVVDQLESLQEQDAGEGE